MRRFFALQVWVSLCVLPFGGSAQTLPEWAVLQERQRVAFADDGVTFSNCFPGARMNGVERVGGDHYRIAITPENEPINDSAWYAFAVESSTDRQITVTLYYSGGKHRYEPVVHRGILAENADWAPLDAERWSVSEDQMSAELLLELKAGEPLYVAGQPMMTPASINRWLLDLANAERSLTVVGYSVGQRPIYALTYGIAEDKPTIVICGGQHPPEYTGRVGLEAFTETLLTESDEAMAAFREQFGLVVIPLINPDGLFEGHWRSNLQGLDTNRHWGDGWQATEPRVVSDYLLALPGETVFFVDFHSTQRNIIYTSPDGTETRTQGVRAAILAALQAQLSELEFTVSSSNNPGKAVSRQWALDQFHCESMTLEFADITPVEAIRNASELAARTMAQSLGARIAGSKQDQNPMP